MARRMSKRSETESGVAATRSSAAAMRSSVDMKSLAARMLLWAAIAAALRS